MMAWERVRILRPAEALARLHASQEQNMAGQPSAAAVPRYLNFMKNLHAFLNMGNPKTSIPFNQGYKQYNGSLCSVQTDKESKSFV
jgi:hypothetical protein